MSSKALDRERRGAYAWLAALVAAKLACVVVLARWGFVSVSADELSRGVRALRWAARPRFDLVDVLTGNWLPFEKYLNGTALLVWREPVVVPRITAFLFSCVLIVAVFALARRISGELRVAVVASLLVAAQPWSAWLSATPALDTYWLACFFVGLECWLAWLEDGPSHAWLWAGTWFWLASGFHYPSWIAVELTYLLSLWPMWRRWRRGERGAVARSLASWAIASSFLALFVAGEWLTTGRPLAFLETHSSYSKWYYGGYRVSLGDKLAYYPRLVATSFQPAAWLLVPFALWFGKGARGRPLGVFPLALGGASLVAVSVLNVGSVPATAAPGRYALFYTIVLAIYASWGWCRCVEWAASRVDRRARRVWLALVGAVLASIVASDLGRWREFPRGMPAGALAAGRRLRSIALERSARGDGGRILLELRYWDFLGVELASGLDDRFVFDRTKDKMRRNLPSLLLGTPEQVRALLARDGVGLVAVFDPTLAARLDGLEFLSRMDEVGGWTIYRASP